MGEVGILNVGAGDTKLVFDPANPEETKKAAGIVTDMLQRGYMIFVQVGENEKGPLYQRATAFDPETCEYTIMDLPPASMAIKPKRKPGRLKKTRIKAFDTKAVAVARSAGG